MTESERRLRSSSSRFAPLCDAGSGSGLGLYIVRTLAERLGAHVGFAADPAGGSVFFIELPALPQHAGQRDRHREVGARDTAGAALSLSSSLATEV